MGVAILGSTSALSGRATALPGSAEPPLQPQALIFKSFKAILFGDTLSNQLTLQRKKTTSQGQELPEAVKHLLLRLVTWAGPL